VSRAVLVYSCGVGALAVLLAGLIIFIHPSFDNIFDRLNYGDVPGWLAGLGTIGALLFAGIAAKAALATNRSQADALKLQQSALAEQIRQYREDQLAAQEEQKSSLARQVAVWIELHSMSPVAFYQNLSGQPIFKVAVGYYGPNNDNQVASITLPPTVRPITLDTVTQLIRLSIQTLPYLIESFKRHYETEVTLKALEEEDGKRQWKEIGRAGPTGLTITFTDVNGNRWHRGRGGGLSTVDANFNIIEGGVG